MTRVFTEMRWGCLFLAVLLSSTAATADPVTVDITIERGEILVHYTGLVTGGLDIYGTDGFHFRGGTAGYGTSAAICTPCTPGKTISLSSFLPPVVGTLQYGGTEYRFDSFLGPGSGSITLVAPSFELPISAGDRAVFTSEFAIRPGVLSIGGVGSFNLSGGGLASGTFRVQPLPTAPGAQLYFFEGLRYQFDPVPEPATFGMFTVGLITATSRLIKRRVAATAGS